MLTAVKWVEEIAQTTKIIVSEYSEFQLLTTHLNFQTPGRGCFILIGRVPNYTVLSRFALETWLGTITNKMEEFRIGNANSEISAAVLVSVIWVLALEACWRRKDRQTTFQEAHIFSFAL